MPFGVIKCSKDKRTGYKRIASVMQYDMDILENDWYSCNIQQVKIEGLINTELYDDHPGILAVSLDVPGDKIYLEQSYFEKYRNALMRMLDYRQKTNLKTLIYSDAGEPSLANFLIRTTTLQFQSTFILLETEKGDYVAARGKSDLHTPISIKDAVSLL